MYHIVRKCIAALHYGVFYGDERNSPFGVSGSCRLHSMLANYKLVRKVQVFLKCQWSITIVLNLHLSFTVCDSECNNSSVWVASPRWFLCQYPLLHIGGVKQCEMNNLVLFSLCCFSSLETPWMEVSIPLMFFGFFFLCMLKRSKSYAWKQLSFLFYVVRHSSITSCIYLSAYPQHHECSVPSFCSEPRLCRRPSS